MITKEDILAVLKSHKSELSKFGVQSIGLFGSYLANNQSDSSDIDLLIEFEPGKTPSLFTVIDLEDVAGDRVPADRDDEQVAGGRRLRQRDGRVCRGRAIAAGTLHEADDGQRIDRAIGSRRSVDRGVDRLRRIAMTSRQGHEQHPRVHSHFTIVQQCSSSRPRNRRSPH